MCILQDCTAQTLLPNLQQHLRSGTVVHSDQWAAYNNVQQMEECFPEFCWPNNWGSHPKCWVILESGQDKVQTHEGCAWVNAVLLPGWIYVERLTWKECIHCSWKPLPGYQLEVEGSFKWSLIISIVEARLCSSFTLCLGCYFKMTSSLLYTVQLYCMIYIT